MLDRFTYISAMELPLWKCVREQIAKTGWKEQVKNFKLSVMVVCGCRVRLTCWLLHGRLKNTLLEVQLKREWLMSNYLLRCGLDLRSSLGSVSFFLMRKL